jgi:site-specific DNA-methyltransferase (adenine-specific)
MWRVEHGDCLDVMRGMADNSVDAVVTDPPYGLSFMGKRWDYDVPAVEVWAECLRLLKPGGHLLAFAGTRTQHRMAVRIEDAGFEIRDMIAWVYGSGFPKSLDVSKAIDKAAGVEREVVGSRVKDDIRGGKMHAANNVERHVIDITAPATPEAQQWVGWGTALKPALEPITVARKPLGGTVAENVLEHGTGAINIDGCRVASLDEIAPVTGKGTLCGTRDGYDRPWKHDPAALAARQDRANAAIEKANTLGRWPANLIHDGSDGVTGLLGDAARFFYCPKASKADRDEGLEDFEVKRTGGMTATDHGSMLTGSGNERTTARANVHPTVKPTDLMRYLCRLVTPPGGIVLDPFTGSGSTGKAAVLEGFQFIGIEREAEYVALARARIAPKIDRQRTLFS